MQTFARLALSIGVADTHAKIARLMHVFSPGPALQSYCGSRARRECIRRHINRKQCSCLRWCDRVRSAGAQQVDMIFMGKRKMCVSAKACVRLGAGVQRVEADVVEFDPSWPRAEIGGMGSQGATRVHPFGGTAFISCEVVCCI